MSTAAKQQNKVPELRFSEFCGEWENNMIGSFSEIKSGHTFQSKYQGKKGEEWLYIKVADISEKSNSKYLKTAINSVSKDVMCEINAKPFRAGSTVFPRVGAALLNNNKRLLHKDSLLDDNVLAVSIFDSKLCDDEFFYYWLATKQISEFCNNGLVPVISASRVKNYYIPIPLLPEQQKIADFLGSVDDWLDNLRSQKTALETYKRGMMQKLFSQQIRFKDENGKDFPDWEDKELGYMLGYKQPTEFIVESTEYCDDYKTPVLTAGKTFILGYTDETKGIFNYELPVIIFDDFTTATQFVDFEFKVKSSAMKILVPLDGNNVKFLYEAMQHIRFDVGGHGRHWISKYSKLTVATPSPEEQARIADFVTALDESIEAKTEEVAKGEQWKKGLMQKMFV